MSILDGTEQVSPPLSPPAAKPGAVLSPCVNTIDINTALEFMLMHVDLRAAGVLNFQLFCFSCSQQGFWRTWLPFFFFLGKRHL